MPDGAYLELLSFTHPESHYPPSSPSRDARRHQPWANKSCGWVAYSFLGAPRATPPLSELINERLNDAGSTTRYAAEVAGGRARPDGVEVEWEITPPARWAEKEGGTRLPFFCGDVTPRDLRVNTWDHSFCCAFCLLLTVTSDALAWPGGIGAHSTDVKHGSSKRCAEHRACPHPGPAQRIRWSGDRTGGHRGRTADRGFGGRARVAA
jgi:hypothetical protein